MDRALVRLRVGPESVSSRSVHDPTGRLCPVRIATLQHMLPWNTFDRHDNEAKTFSEMVGLRPHAGRRRLGRVGGRSRPALVTEVGQIFGRVTEI